MLVLAMLCLAASASASYRNFNITYLDVPQTVAPGQLEVEIECGYDANLTLLSWYKGANEFFRYRPGAAPSTRSFPIVGVGSVEMLKCGPAFCQLKLGAMTEQATGLYRCDIERDVPPYGFASLSAHMEVYGHELRQPLLQGLAKEYADGDMIVAYCRGGPESELRWYINAVEQKEFRGLTTLRTRSTRLLFMGVPLTAVVQCAEFRYGKIYGSRQQTVNWRSDIGQMRTKNETENLVQNEAIVISGRLGLLSIVLCLFVKVFYV